MYLYLHLCIHTYMRMLGIMFLTILKLFQSSASKHEDQDDPTLVLKKHGGWALGKTAPLMTKKARTRIASANLAVGSGSFHTLQTYDLNTEAVSSIRAILEMQKHVFVSKAY